LGLVESLEPLSDDHRVRRERRYELDRLPPVEGVPDRLQPGVAVEGEHQGLGEQPALDRDEHADRPFWPPSFDSIPFQRVHALSPVRVLKDKGRGRAETCADPRRIPRTSDRRRRHYFARRIVIPTRRDAAAAFGARGSATVTTRASDPRPNALGFPRTERT